MYDYTCLYTNMCFHIETKSIHNKIWLYIITYGYVSMNIFMYKYIYFIYIAIYKSFFAGMK